MADKSKKKNIFQKMGQVFKEVRQELKKSVWPTKEKLKSTSAVVLAVILFFAVFLSFISLGGRWVLDKANFYDEVEQTTAAADDIVAQLDAAAPVDEVVIETGAIETEAASQETSVAETAAAESEG